MLFEKNLYFLEALFESIPTFLILSIILWKSEKVVELREVVVGTNQELWNLENIGQEKALFLFTFLLSLGMQFECRE